MPNFMQIHMVILDVNIADGQTHLFYTLCVNHIIVIHVRII